MRVILLISLLAAFSLDCYSETQPDTKRSSGAITRGGDAVHRTVPFITIRNKTGSKKASKYFGDERSTEHAGYCDVSSTPIKTLRPIAERVPYFLPENREKLVAIRESTVEGLWQDIKQTSQGQEPILYTHGFYISFEKACKRSSYFQESLGLEGRLLLYSWPSDGSLLNYTRDESDLYWSVNPLVESLSNMVNRFGAGKVNLAAHSLGTRGIFLALVRMAQAKSDDKPLFNQVVLLAPDIDAGIFKQYLQEIKSVARTITVYVSANDRPLALSRQVHGYSRLGEAGKHLQGLEGIEIIDLSDIPVRYPSGHVYHLYHDSVINDLNQLLNEAKTASQRSNLKQIGENYWKLQLPGAQQSP